MNKKEAIVLAAIDLFVEKGFDKVSTASIAKKADVATGTLFHHYKTKEELINAAYLLVKSQFIQHAISIDSTQSRKEALNKMWERLVDWALTHHTKYNYMLQFKHSPYFRKDIMENEEVYQVISEWWQSAYNENYFKDIPLDFILQYFYSTLDSTIAYLIKTQKDKENYIQYSFAMVWDAITSA